MALVTNMFTGCFIVFDIDLGVIHISGLELLAKQAFKQTSQCRWEKHKALENTYTEKFSHQECCPNFEYKSVNQTSLYHFCEHKLSLLYIVTKLKPFLDY